MIQRWLGPIGSFSTLMDERIGANSKNHHVIALPQILFKQRRVSVSVLKN